MREGGRAPLELGEPLGGEGLACGWSESGIGNECLSASSPVVYPVNVDIETVKKAMRLWVETSICPM